jgi:hypothetical protein
VNSEFLRCCRHQSVATERPNEIHSSASNGGRGLIEQLVQFLWIVRRVDQSGSLNKLAGFVSLPAPEPPAEPARAVPCVRKPVGFSQLRLVSLSALAYAPAEQSLYVIDLRLLYLLESTTRSAMSRRTRRAALLHSETPIASGRPTDRSELVGGDPQWC